MLRVATSTRSGGRTTTSRSPSSTCRSWAATATTCGPAWRGCAAAPTAAAYAAKKHAGTVAQQRDRWAGLAERGVGTVFVSTPDLNGPDDVLALAGLTA